MRSHQTSARLRRGLCSLDEIGSADPQQVRTSYPLPIGAVIALEGPASDVGLYASKLAGHAHAAWSWAAARRCGKLASVIGFPSRSANDTSVGTRHCGTKPLRFQL